MTEEQLLFICDNQTIWRKMYLLDQSQKLQDFRDVCRAYQTKKRMQKKGIQPRDS